MEKTRSLSLPSLALPKALGIDLSLLANIAQLALLLSFGYWLIETSLTGEADYGFLAWWTGATAVLCGSLALFLEQLVVSGGARILTTLEVCGYLLWLGTGYVGIPITDSPLKTGGILALFLTWNGLQLCWRMGQVRAQAQRKYLSFEELIGPAEKYAKKRSLDIADFLQQIQDIVKDSTPREEVMDAWSRLPPGHMREFLRRVL